ncbi:MAG: hypothetical protein ACRELT_07865 [Longimicrobiales bacterium]
MAEITVSRRIASAQIFLLRIEGERFILVRTGKVLVSPDQRYPLTETVYGTHEEVRQEGGGEEAGREEGGAEEGREEGTGTKVGSQEVGRS